ncbi:hypothetical protein QMG25_09530 [Arthrobacter sp. H35-D1]|nr:hypothetical protein [Arthrobacter sp. H35-D1]
MTAPAPPLDTSTTGASSSAQGNGSSSPSPSMGSANAPSTDSDSGPGPNSDSSSTPAESHVLTPEKKGQALTLADFFNPSSSWSESRYNLADKQDISGISAGISSCSDSSAETLELRLANNFSNLTFSVGQANDSINSNQSLSVRVTGNNKQLDVQSVPFNEIQKFDVPVAGVNATTIEVHLDSDAPDCGGSVKAVIYDIELS